MRPLNEPTAVGRGVVSIHLFDPKRPATTKAAFGATIRSGLPVWTQPGAKIWYETWCYSMSLYVSEQQARG